MTSSHHGAGRLGLTRGLSLLPVPPARGRSSVAASADGGEEVVLLTEVLEVGETDPEEEGSAAEEAEEETEAEEAEEGEERASRGEQQSSSSSSGEEAEGVGISAEAAAWSQMVHFPQRLATLNGQRVRNLAQLAAAMVAAAAVPSSSSSSPADAASQQQVRILRLSAAPVPGSVPKWGGVAWPGRLRRHEAAESNLVRPRAVPPLLVRVIRLVGAARLTVP